MKKGQSKKPTKEETVQMVGYAILERITKGKFVVWFAGFIANLAVSVHWFDLGRFDHFFFSAALAFGCFCMMIMNYIKLTRL